MFVFLFGEQALLALGAAAARVVGLILTDWLWPGRLSLGTERTATDATELGAWRAIGVTGQALHLRIPDSVDAIFRESE